MHIGSFLTRLPGWPARLAPSLYDLIPHADALPRSIPRPEVVPVDAIAGTVRQPSNTTADFLPITSLRTTHWKHDWLRILEAQENMASLPPVELIKVGRQYFVVDGHKRVAAARRIGAALDAMVVELRLPRAANAAACREREKHGTDTGPENSHQSPDRGAADPRSSKSGAG
jgi:hypothetical protein